MAHLLNSSKDMAYVGQKPWHGLGTQLDQHADLDQWRVAANLNWTAEKRQTYYSTRKLIDVDGTYKNVPTPIKDHYALVRDDTQECLGKVSDRYHIVQPADVLEFYRNLTDTMDYTLETAGCLAGGKRIWALAKTAKTTRIKGQDKVDGYLLLATSYDATMATQARFTSVRVVCQNTLSFALSGSGGNAVSVGHNTQFNAQRVKQQLGIYDESWEQFEEVANKLAETPFSNESAVEYFGRVIGDSAYALKNGRMQPSAVTQKMFRLTERGKGQNFASAHGTYWGLVNAVTEYYDHHSKARGKSAVQKADSRMNSAWFGRSATIKEKALQVACEMADIQVAA